jgi:hypothetical protein
LNPRQAGRGDGRAARAAGPGLQTTRCTSPDIDSPGSAQGTTSPVPFRLRWTELVFEPGLVRSELFGVNASMTVDRPQHAPFNLLQPTDGGLPAAHGLYDPANEHDACGVGFVAHIKGERSHQIIDDADRILRHMVHRGACGCEENTGDGAGMLTALPYEFLERVAREDIGIELPERGQYGVGNIFLPTDESDRQTCKATVERIVAAQGQRVLGWRKLPQQPVIADIGPSARASEPHMEQLFVGAAEGQTSIVSSTSSRSRPVVNCGPGRSSSGSCSTSAHCRPRC